MNNTNFNDNNNTGPNQQNPNRPSNGYQGNRNPYPNHVNSQRSPNYGNSPYPNNTNRAGPNNSNFNNNRFPRPRVNFIRATEGRQRGFNRNRRSSYRRYEERRRSLERDQPRYYPARRSNSLDDTERRSNQERPEDYRTCLLYTSPL